MYFKTKRTFIYMSTEWKLIIVKYFVSISVKCSISLSLYCYQVLSEPFHVIWIHGSWSVVATSMGLVKERGKSKRVLIAIESRSKQLM